MLSKKRTIFIGMCIFILIVVSTVMAEWWNPLDWFSSDNTNGLTQTELKDKFIYDKSKESYSLNLDEVNTEINSTNVKLTKWEAYITLGVPDNINLSDITTGDNKTFKKDSDKLSLKWYAKSISDINGFEYEIILKQNPSVNTFSIPIETNNLNFYYQPPLYEEFGLIEPNASCNATDCEQHYRPIDVVGSYAVYSLKSNNEYMTGKAFHIYRPLITDAINNTIWGVLNITNDALIISIDSSWLDNAAYPVIIDPTFGYTTVGGSNAWTGLNEIFATSNETISSSGTMVNISIYAALYSGMLVTFGLYSGATPTTKVGTEKNTTVVGTFTGWYNFSVDSVGSITLGTTYWIAGNSDDDMNVYYDVLTGTNRYWDNTVYGTTWPAIFSQDSSSGARYSLYATYTLTSNSCSPSSPLTSDYVFEASDYCNQTSNLNAGGYNILINGSGQITFDDANLTNYNQILVKGVDSNNKAILLFTNGGGIR